MTRFPPGPAAPRRAAAWTATRAALTAGPLPPRRLAEHIRHAAEPELTYRSAQNLIAEAIRHGHLRRRNGQIELTELHRALESQTTL